MTAATVPVEIPTEEEEVAWAFHPDAQRWKDFGFDTLLMVRQWQACGGTIRTAITWVAPDPMRGGLFTAEEAIGWAMAFQASRRMQRLPELMSKLSGQNITLSNVALHAETAADWDRSGFDPVSAAQWASRDFAHQLASVLVHADPSVTPKQEASRWRAAGINGATRLMLSAHYVPLETAVEWARFLPAGYTWGDDVMRWWACAIDAMIAGQAATQANVDRFNPDIDLTATYEPRRKKCRWGMSHYTHSGSSPR